jgi:hypothetical protein
VSTKKLPVRELETLEANDNWLRVVIVVRGRLGAVAFHPPVTFLVRFSPREDRERR